VTTPAFFVRSSTVTARNRIGGSQLTFSLTLPQRSGKAAAFRRLTAYTSGMSLPADTIFFYSARRGDPRYRGLSNFAISPFWAPNPFDVDGPPLLFKTNEHYFNAHKTLDEKQFMRVLEADRPGEAKQRGRRVTLRPDWDNHHRYHVMLAGLRLKFAIPEFRDLLLSTGTRHLAEDSRDDFVWGCRDRTGGYGGRNLLGRALMRVRAEIITPV
jgi:ribA/ribD-fused uncharacterized protein